MGKEFTCNAGDTGDVGSIPGSGRSPVKGNGNPLQYSCLENSMAEEPGRLQSMGSQREDRTLQLKTNIALHNSQNTYLIGIHLVTS